MSTKSRVVVGRARNLTSKFFESLAFRLGDQQRREDTAEHEESKDLHDVVEPRGGVGLGRATGTQRTEDALRDDGTDFAGGGGDTVRGGTVASREAFTRNDESGGVRTEVEEELGEDEERDETAGAGRGLELVVGETDDDEDDGEHDEAHELDGFAAEGVDGGNGDPVTRDSAGADDDEVTDSGVVEDFVDGVAGGVADGGQDDRVVERDTVESDVEEEPGTGGTEEDLAVLPLAVVAAEVAPGSLGGSKTVASVLDTSDTDGLVGLALSLASEVGLGVLITLDNVAGNIEGVARSLGDGKTEVQGDAARNSAEADDNTPHLVDGETADTTAVGDGRSSQERLLETLSDDQADDTSGELADTLHGEDGAHHGTTPFGSSEFGSDNRRTVLWCC